MSWHWVKRNSFSQSHNTRVGHLPPQGALGDRPRCGNGPHALGGDTGLGGEHTRVKHHTPGEAPKTLQSPNALWRSIRSSPAVGDLPSPRPLPSSLALEQAASGVPILRPWVTSLTKGHPPDGPPGWCQTLPRPSIAGGTRGPAPSEEKRSASSQQEAGVLPKTCSARMPLFCVEPERTGRCFWQFD